MKRTGKTIGFYSYGRKQSQRCPNKVLRPFSDTTLCDIMMVKLKEVGGKDAFYAGYEDEFKEKAGNHGIKFVKRSQNSTLIDAPITECQEFLKRVNYDYLFLANTCVPFLKVSTMRKFLEGVIENDYQPAIAVIKRYNYFYFNDGRPLNFSASIKTQNTKTVTPLFEQANALYFFNRKYFFEKERYWDWEKVRLVELDNKLELIDIDTEEDFIIAESIWKQNKSFCF